MPEKRHQATLLYAQLHSQLQGLPRRDVSGQRQRLMKEYEQLGVRAGSFYKFVRQNQGTRRADAGQLRRINRDPAFAETITDVYRIQCQMSDFEGGRWVGAEAALKEAARRGLCILQDAKTRRCEDAETSTHSKSAGRDLAKGGQRTGAEILHAEDGVQDDKPVLSVRNYNLWVAKLRLRTARGFNRFQADYSNHVHQFDVSGATTLQVVRDGDDEDWLLARRPPRQRLSKVQRAAGHRLWMAGIVDDYSGVFVFQYYVGAGENSAALRLFLDQAWRGLDPQLCLRGLPEILYVDNGSFANNEENIPYLSEEMGVGVELQRCEPYNPRAKGKIERTWRTIKNSFEAPFLSDARAEWRLSEVNEMAISFCIEMSKRQHRTLPQARADVWLAGLKQPARIPADDALRRAHKTYQRRVDGSGIFQLDNVRYELPAAMRSQTVLIFRNALGELVAESLLSGERVAATVWEGAHAWNEFRSAKETEFERTAKAREKQQWGETEHPYKVTPLPAFPRMAEEGVRGGNRSNVVPFVAADKEKSKGSPFTVAAEFKDEIDAKTWVARELGIGLLQLNRDYPQLRQQLNELLAGQAGRYNREEISAWIIRVKQELWGGADAAEGGGL